MNLDALLARFGGADEDGDGWVAVCPSHVDSKPSLRIAVGRTGAVMVKCRARCSTEDVLAAVGLHFSDLFDVEGIETVERRATSTSAPASPADVAALAVRLDAYAAALSSSPMPDSPARDALSYAELRFGLHYADVERLGLGVADDLGGGPRLVVPFRDARGIARGFQARALDPQAAVRWLGPKSPDGASWARWGYFPAATDWPQVVIAEGPGDALTAVAAGFSSIAVRGAALAGSVASELAEVVGDRLAVVAGDGDASGAAFSSTLAHGLADLGVHVRIVTPPTGHDLSSWREQDPSTFERVLSLAIGEASDVRSSAPGDLIRLVGADFVKGATDVAGARLLRGLIQDSGSDVRHSPEAGFFLLDAGVWRPDRLDAVRTFAQTVSDTLREAVASADWTGYDEGDRKRTQAAIIRYAAHAQTTRGIDSMLRELQALPGVATRLEDFDARPDVLAARNGVIDLRTGDLLPNDPGLLLTRRIELDYDPAASAPRWEAFLSEVSPAFPAMPDYLRRLVGYGITGSTDEQCFAVLWGTGANGKSVFTDTLTAVFREVTVTTPFSTFEQRQSGGIPNDLAALKGSRLVMAAEGEQGRPMAEAILKRVTGRDLIAARFMRKEFFEFRPTFLLLLATNYKPQFRGQDEGLWRRVKLLPWERYFRPEERDPQLGQKLLGEAQGILAWAVRGAVEWYAGGLADPAFVVSATREYRQTSDALAGFIAQDTDDFLGVAGFMVTGSETDVVLGRDLWDAYVSWTDEEGIPARERWTRRTFFAALEERGLEKRKRAQGVAFSGVRKVKAADRELDESDGSPPPRAAEPALALSSTVPAPIPAGPSLADVL